MDHVEHLEAEERDLRILGMADLLARAAMQPTPTGDFRTSEAVGRATHLLADDFLELLAARIGAVANTPAVR